MRWTKLRTPSAALAVAALVGMLLIEPTTAQASPPRPQLSIAVDNGETTAAAGDTLTYAIIVKNLSATHIRDLRVSQTMPEGLEFTSADKSGEATRQAVVWTVDVAPTRQAVLHTTMEVAKTPQDLLRLATVACAGLSARKPPVVCATHSDELPAGAEAAAAALRPRTDDEVSSRLSTAQYAGLGGLLVLLIALGALAVRRKGARASRQ